MSRYWRREIMYCYAPALAGGALLSYFMDDFDWVVPAMLWGGAVGYVYGKLAFKRGEQQ